MKSQRPVEKNQGALEFFHAMAQAKGGAEIVQDDGDDTFDAWK